MDLVEGILFGWQRSREKINYFNLGVDSTTTVTRIAEMVVEEMGLEKVEFTYTGGSRGWIGDVPTFKYSLTKINALGWKAQRSSDDAVRLAVKAVLGKLP
jgi:UDP-glucose 4-epimerase